MMNRLSKQRGYTATAMIIMLSVGGILTAGVARNTIKTSAENSGTAVGSMLAQVNKATGTYTVNNYAALVIGSGNLAPTVGDLQNAGLLNANVGTPPMGGTYAIQISREPAGCVAPNCNLTSRVWLTLPIRNADTGGIDIRKLGAATDAIGGDGGWSDAISPGTVHGAGGWNRPNPAGSQAGILMAINGYGSSAFSQYVDRAGKQGMLADFQMGGNNIAGANGINANTVTLPGGQGLQIGSVRYYGDTLNSAIRVPANGGVFLERQDGTPAHIGSVGNINSSGQINSASMVSAGQIYGGNIVSATDSYTNGNAQVNGLLNAGRVNATDMQSTGTAAMNQLYSTEAYTSGWYRSQGDGGWYSQKWNGGLYMSDGSWIRSYADKNMYTGGQMQAGSVQANGSMTVLGASQINGNQTVGGQQVVGGSQIVYGSVAASAAVTPGQIASDGANCGGNAGAIARDGNNNLFICN
jgi:hypothetical protein